MSPTRIIQALIIIGAITGLASAMMLASSTITTYAGTGSSGYSGDGGAATSGTFDDPEDVATDSADNLYICDKKNEAIRKVTAATGIISTIAGTGSAGYTGDGGAATAAKIDEPRGIAVDSSSNVYFSDKGNAVIRKVTAATGFISTYAGTGSTGYSGDGGAATSAKLSEPMGMTFDSSDNLYFSDKGNEVVRKITAATGIITTIAGTGSAGSSGDGGAATSAKLEDPHDVVVDSSGNVYIADKKNEVIRKVTIATGIISKYAGTGSSGFSGDGGAATSAKFDGPERLTMDSADNLFISDKKNDRIRKVTAATGVITTIIGTGSAGYTGDGGDPTLAKIDEPRGLTLDSSGHLYFCGKGNSVIRKVTNVGTMLSSVTVITWQELEP